MEKRMYVDVQDDATVQSVMQAVEAYSCGEFDVPSTPAEELAAAFEDTFGIDVWSMGTVVTANFRDTDPTPVIDVCKTNGWSYGLS